MAKTPHSTEPTEGLLRAASQGVEEAGLVPKRPQQVRQDIVALAYPKEPHPTG